MRESMVSSHGVDVAIWEVGAGHPLLILHGLGLDHIGIADELEWHFDSDSAWRRIYVDLPGVGKTPGPHHLASADAILDVIGAIVEERIGETRFALLGQSYGGYLALGALARYRPRVSGLALLIPVIEPSDDRRILPDPLKVREDERAMSALPTEFVEVYRDLVVDETPGLVAALDRSWLSSMSTADTEYIDRLRSDGYSFTSLDPTEGSYGGPALVLCGRHDAVVGYEQAMGLLPRLHRGTLAVLDGAGHLAQLEKPGLTRALIADWLLRVEAEESR